jgi:hypothetical protein
LDAFLEQAAQEVESMQVCVRFALFEEQFDHPSGSVCIDDRDDLVVGGHRLIGPQPPFNGLATRRRVLLENVHEVERELDERTLAGGLGRGIVTLGVRSASFAVRAERAGCRLTLGRLGSSEDGATGRLSAGV